MPAYHSAGVRIVSHVTEIFASRVLISLLTLLDVGFEWTSFDVVIKQPPVGSTNIREPPSPQ